MVSKFLPESRAPQGRDDEELNLINALNPEMDTPKWEGPPQCCYLPGSWGLPGLLPAAGGREGEVSTRDLHSLQVGGVSSVLLPSPVALLPWQMGGVT